MTTSPNALPQLSVGALGALLVAGLCAGLLPWPWIFGCMALLLPLAHPIWGLALLVASVTAQDSVRILGGLSLTQAAIPLALAGWGARVLAHPDQRLGLGKSAAAWGVFLLALLLATTLSPYGAAEGLKELWRWGAACLAWLIAATMLRKPWHGVLLVCALLGGPLLNALIGLRQFVQGDGPEAFRIAAQSPYVRAYGTIGQPNSFAGYMNLAWPLALALAVAWSWLVVKGIRSRWNIQDTDELGGQKLLRYRKLLLNLAVAVLLWAVTVALCAALVASFSRGAWIGAVIGAAGMLLSLGALLGRRLMTRRWVAVGCCAVGCGLIVLALGGIRLLPPAALARVESIAGSIRLFDPATVTITSQNFAVVERMAQLWAGWQMFLAHPVTGVGPGNYSLAYPAVASSPWFASRGHAHNYYVHLAAEAGLIGVLAYLALLSMVIGDLWHALRRSEGVIRRGVLIGIAGMCAALMGHNLFEHLHVLHLSIQSAAAWGIAAAFARMTEEV